METDDRKILNNYLGLLERLSPEMKVNIIEELSESIKSGKASKTTMKSAFGAWESEESAEELIDKILESRHIDRKIEDL